MIYLISAMSQINIITTSVEAVILLFALAINIYLILNIKRTHVKYKHDPYVHEEKIQVVYEKTERKSKNKSRRERKLEKRNKRNELKEENFEKQQAPNIEENKDQTIESEEKQEENEVINVGHQFLSPETPMFEQVFFKKTEAPEVEIEIDDNGLEVEGKITFASKLATTSVENKVLYNALKNHIMEYKNIKNRVVNGGEYFRYPGHQIIKIILIGKVLRMAIDLDPKAYDYNVYHQKDRSNMKKYQETPLFVKVNSRLGLLRANQLVDDVMKKYGVKFNKNYEYFDYARELTDQVMISEQEEGKFSATPINN